jgi:hypothetical protein
MKAPFPTPANRPAAAFLAVLWFCVGLLAIWFPFKTPGVKDRWPKDPDSRA